MLDGDKYIYVKYIISYEYKVIVALKLVCWPNL